MKGMLARLHDLLAPSDEPKMSGKEKTILVTPDAVKEMCEVRSGGEIKSQKLQLRTLCTGNAFDCAEHSSQLRPVNRVWCYALRGTRAA